MDVVYTKVDGSLIFFNMLFGKRRGRGRRRKGEKERVKERRERERIFTGMSPLAMFASFLEYMVANTGYTK